jgi:two-component system, OmpR family, copper resistance phosphate regulon response regulator CusR
MSRLLVIEDHAKLLRTLQRGLQEEGYAVSVAGNGADGYELARGSGVDAVILDLMLPGQDGLTVLRNLRRDGFGKPILIMTARDAIAERVTGLDAGADDYLVKPFAFDELLARLRALLRRSAAPEPTRLAVAGLEMDLIRRRVLRNGQLIELTPRQFELLQYLMRHAGYVVSREMIVRDVWQDSSGIQTNIVEVSMNHLRRRIERPEWPQLLHTVRGAGYELRGHV